MKDVLFLRHPYSFCVKGDNDVSKLEREIQPRIIGKIKQRLPGAKVFKGDTRFQQGTPDLIILYQDRWAMLEVKRSSTATRQPNQEYFVDELNQMSYAALIHPDNEEDILDEVQRALQAERCPLLSEPE